jgi:RNA polymerase sigma factor (TIGR02999 family)
MTESSIAGSGDQPTDASNAEHSAEELLPIVYEQLRQLARHRMSLESGTHTLQATALVHEAYLRLSGGSLRFNSRAHFFRMAAEAMRRILIEHARASGRVKRGGGVKPLPINVLDLAAVPEPEQILAFDEAIERLEKETPSAGAVVRLRFFAGLSVDETAEALGLSPRTVDREWKYARAWLFRMLSDQPTG